MRKVLAVQFNVTLLGIYGSSHATYARYSVMVRAMCVCSSHVQSVMNRRMSHEGWMCRSGVMRSGWALNHEVMACGKKVNAMSAGRTTSRIV